jgi:hypothetical protein
MGKLKSENKKKIEKERRRTYLDPASRRSPAGVHSSSPAVAHEATQYHSPTQPMYPFVGIRLETKSSSSAWPPSTRARAPARRRAPRPRLPPLLTANAQRRSYKARRSPPFPSLCSIFALYRNPSLTDSGHRRRTKLPRVKPSTPV